MNTEQPEAILFAEALAELDTQFSRPGAGSFTGEVMS